MVRLLATEDLELNFSMDYSKTNAQPGPQSLLSEFYARARTRSGPLVRSIGRSTFTVWPDRSSLE